MRKHDLAPERTRAAVEEIFERTEDLGRRGVELEVLTVDNPVDHVLLLERLRRADPVRAADVEKLLLWNGGNQSGVAIAAIDPQGLVHPDQFSWQVNAGDVRRQRFAEIWRDQNPVLGPYRRRPRRLSGRAALLASRSCATGACRRGRIRPVATPGAQIPPVTSAMRR